MACPFKVAAAHGLVLRPMDDADLPFVAALYASTRAEEVAQTGWPAEMQAAFLRQQHEAQHQHYQAHYDHAEWLIIEQAGEAIGRLYWYEGEQSVHIVDISLMPQARGLGLGTAILGDLAEHAARLGKGVSIYVEKTNPACRLYERLGFAVAEDHGVYDLMRRPHAPASAPAAAGDQLKIAS